MSGITFYSGITLNDGMIPYGVPVLPPPVQADTFLVGAGPFGTYGANETNSNYDIIGDINSDYASLILYLRSGYGNTTLIIVDAGSYSGFSVDSVNSIDGDTASYPRTFTVDGTNHVLYYQPDVGGGMGAYLTQGDIFNIESNLGNVLSIVYDPNEQPNYSANTMIVDFYSTYSTSYYGANAYTSDLSQVFGSLLPNYLYSAYFIYNYPSVLKTVVRLKDGSYSGFTVSSGAIDGDTNNSIRTFTFNSTDKQLSYVSSTQTYETSGDTFGLQDILGSTNTMVYDPAKNNIVDDGYYVAGTDYSDGSTSGPGMLFVPPGGPYTSNSVFIYDSGWSNLVGKNALLALSNGQSFYVSTVLSGGGAPSNSTITLTSDWENPYSGQWRADMNASPAINTNYPYSIPAAVWITSGGGGGGGGGTGPTVVLVSGAWFPDGTIYFALDADNTAGITAMDAIASGAPLTITDDSGSTNVTLVGTLTKSDVLGPPGGPYRIYYDGVVTTNNTEYPDRWIPLVSVTT